MCSHIRRLSQCYDRAARRGLLFRLPLCTTIYSSIRTHIHYSLCVLVIVYMCPGTAGKADKQTDRQTDKQTHPLPCQARQGALCLARQGSDALPCLDKRSAALPGACACSCYSLSLRLALPLSSARTESLQKADPGAHSLKVRS